MGDLGIYLFGGIGLSFSLVIIVEVQRFKGRAEKRRYISRSDLRQITLRFIKYSLLAWLAFALLFIGIFLITEGQSSRTLFMMLIFCLVGPLLMAISILVGHLVILRNLFGLSVEDSEDEQY